MWVRQAYHALRPAISSLVLLLHDEEEKTRANAAGALGNLVRNSYVQSCTYAIACVGGVSSMGCWVRALLVPDMVAGKAVEALLHTVGHDSSPAPRRIGAPTMLLARRCSRC